MRRKFVERDDRDLDPLLVEPAPRLLLVARRDAGEAQARHAVGELAARRRARWCQGPRWRCACRSFEPLRIGMAVIRCDNSSGNACLTCSDHGDKASGNQYLWRKQCSRLVTAALAAILATGRRRDGAGLSDPAGHHGDPVRGRRPDRRARPRGRGAHERNPRPAGGGRERRRRRRHDRLEARRDRGAGRLPDGARHGRHPCAGPDAVQEAALQFGRPSSRRSRCSPRCRSS